MKNVALKEEKYNVAQYAGLQDFLTILLRATLHPVECWIL
jgi:hypothetical protein